ncbi:NAD-dependent succinate-semialdehyde dehydrogenase [Pseudonocardia nantongensis]|uniref:NAD-dependent succinate-semialdehyde dehydrogenase n=1 Tax=Pseudonocardia nantongensis TaxID=1181885 RepID=UPI00397DEDB9
MTTTADERRVTEAAPTGLFIRGAWRSAQNGATTKVEDPATGEVLAEVADASPADGMDALDAAQAAQPVIAAMPPRERSEILYRAYRLLHERADDLAMLMTLEMGKPLAEARGEVVYASEFLRWFAEEAVRIDGGYQVAPNGQTRFLTIREPVGVCVFVTPWNFPLAMGTRKIAPAIAAGCASIIKPAPQTPLTMLAFAQVLADAGLPDGALNVITATDAGGVMEPIIRDGRARKISFTGSTPVGKKLLAQAADKVLRSSLELGGNASFIVLDDADVDAAIEGAMIAKMRNMGEACTAANRFYVQRGVADEFARKLADRMGALKVGRGTEEGVNVGPLIDAKGRDKVVDLVADAVANGAGVALGGEPQDGPGYFYPPTVLTDVPENSRLNHEEIFGPVAPITVVDSADQALAAANATEFGLVNYVYTRDLNQALRIAENLQSGMIGLNTGLVSNPAAPFGGVKESGLGREGGMVGIDEFLETKYVAIGFSG